MNAEIRNHPLSPLHFAAIAGLKNQIKQLLANNVAPNIPTQAANFDVAPLHVAIANSNGKGFFFRTGCLEIPFDFEHDDFSKDQRILQRYQRSLEITKFLVDSGANINQQVVINRMHESLGTLETVTPLVLSLLCGNLSVTNFLLNVGAEWDAIAEINPEKTIDICSVKTLLKLAPDWEYVVERVAEPRGHIGMMDTLEQWRRIRDQDEDENDVTHPLVRCSISTNTDPQKAFINAFTNEKWQHVRELLADNSGINLNCFNQEGNSAVVCATTADQDTLLYLLEHGADPNLLKKGSCGAVGRAVCAGQIGIIKILLKFGGDIEHVDPSGFTPLFHAVISGDFEVLQVLINCGADIHAVLNDGSSALLVAIGQNDVRACSALLLAGVDPNIPDSWGVSPLYEACNRGLKDVVEVLLALPSVLTNTLDTGDIYLSSPLHVAACRGFDRIVKMLLDHGAKVDQEGPRGLGSPLLEACANDHSTVLRLLLARGASLEVAGSRFGSAAGTARAFRRERILNILEAHEVHLLLEEEDELMHGGSSESSGDVNDCGDTHTAPDE